MLSTLSADEGEWTGVVSLSLTSEGRLACLDRAMPARLVGSSTPAGAA